MGTTIKAGVCGYGALGHVHANGLHQLPGVRIEAVCDKRPEQLTAKEVAFNVQTDAPAFDVRECRTYTDFGEMLSREKLDVVAMALPTDLHAEYAIRALDAGCHVFSEKPMALTPAECDRMLAAARRAGRQLMVAQCLRFWPEYEWLLGAIRDRRYGRLRSLTMERIGAYTTWSCEDWMNTPVRAGGMILDLHLHDVDWAWHALGKPRRLCAAGRRGARGGMDDVTAVWEYDETLVTLRGSWLTAGFTMDFRAIFDEATIEFGVHPDPALRLRRHGGAPDEKPPVSTESGYLRELRYFLECVRGEHPNAVCPPESTAASVALIAKESEAIARGTWLEL